MTGSTSTSGSQFQVAVHDTFSVGLFQRFGDLDDQAAGAAPRLLAQPDSLKAGPQPGSSGYRARVEQTVGLAASDAWTVPGWLEHGNGLASRRMRAHRLRVGIHAPQHELEHHLRAFEALMEHDQTTPCRRSSSSSDASRDRSCAPLVRVTQCPSCYWSATARRSASGRISTLAPSPHGIQVGHDRVRSGAIRSSRSTNRRALLVAVHASNRNFVHSRRSTTSP